VPWAGCEAPAPGWGWAARLAPKACRRGRQASGPSAVHRTRQVAQSAGQTEGSDDCGQRFRLKPDADSDPRRTVIPMIPSRVVVDMCYGVRWLPQRQASVPWQRVCTVILPSRAGDGRCGQVGPGRRRRWWDRRIFVDTTPLDRRVAEVKVPTTRQVAHSHRLQPVGGGHDQPS
jgi:hypothetical protein